MQRQTKMRENVTRKPQFSEKKKRFSKPLLLLLKIVNIEIAIWVAEKHDFIFSCQTLLRRLFIFNVYLHVCKKLDTIFHEPKPTHHSKGVLQHIHLIFFLAHEKLLRISCYFVCILKKVLDFHMRRFCGHCGGTMGVRNRSLFIYLSPRGGWGGRWQG